MESRGQEIWASSKWIWVALLTIGAGFCGYLHGTEEAHHDCMHRGRGDVEVRLVTELGFPVTVQSSPHATEEFMVRLGLCKGIGQLR